MMEDAAPGRVLGDPPADADAGLLASARVLAGEEELEGRRLQEAGARVRRREAGEIGGGREETSRRKLEAAVDRLLVAQRAAIRPQVGASAYWGWPRVVGRRGCEVERLKT
jgi:hypothetical protein